MGTSINTETRRAIVRLEQTRQLRVFVLMIESFAQSLEVVMGVGGLQIQQV